MFRITLVPPAMDEAIERDFARGLGETYRHFGVGEAVHVLPEAQRRCVTHVVVQDPDGAVVGGARVHRAGRGSPLPALRALTDQPALRAALIGPAARTGPPVELAALWVARGPTHRGLGRLIAQASIAVAAIKGASRAVTFSHHTIEALLLGIGMRPVRDVPPIGYPSPQYRSTIYEVEPRAPIHAESADLAQIEAFGQHWSDQPASIEIAHDPRGATGLPWTVRRTQPAVAA